MIILLFVIFLVLGINVRYHVILVLFILGVLLFILLRKRKKKLLILFIPTFCLGVGLSFIRFDIQKNTFSGFVIEAKTNYILLNCGLERFYYYEKNHDYEFGDYLTIEGKKSLLDFEVIESSFDYNHYLNLKGVYYQINAKKVAVKFHFFLRLRKIKNNFLNNFSSEAKSLVNAILFGENDYSEINMNIINLSLSRFLSISGVYLYAFLAFFNYLLSFFLKEKYSRLISLILLSFYLVFTIFKFSVLKITFLYILRWLNDYVFKKKQNYFTLLGFSALIFLIFDFHIAYQSSFLLGYTIPLFICISMSSFNFKKNYLNKFITIALVSSFLLPLNIASSNEINFLSPIFQIIFSPLFIFYAFSSLFCFLGLPIYSFINYFSNGIFQITSKLNKYSLALYVPSLNDIFFVIYLLLYFLVLYYASIKFKKMRNMFVYILTFLFLIYALPINNLFYCSVNFINVGQGDSLLIRNRNINVLIDTGGKVNKDIAQDSLIPYFKSQRIYALDLVITTHDDFDHSGAFASLNEHFVVKKHLSSYLDFPYKIGSLEFKNYNVFSDIWLEENDSSLVIGFSLLNKYFLIMGDAPIKIEKRIIEKYQNLKCDVLKVGHHGSDTSSSKEFLNYVKPEYAVISVGKNKYGHPSKSVISLLNKNGVKIKRTDKEGTITFK